MTPKIVFRLYIGKINDILISKAQINFTFERKKFQADWFLLFFFNAYIWLKHTIISHLKYLNR